MLKKMKSRSGEALACMMASRNVVRLSAGSIVSRVELTTRLVCRMTGAGGGDRGGAGGGAADGEGDVGPGGLAVREGGGAVGAEADQVVQHRHVERLLQRRADHLHALAVVAADDVPGRPRRAADERVD